jgi:hypothetical protein
LLLPSRPRAGADVAIATGKVVDIDSVIVAIATTPSFIIIKTSKI